PLFDVPPDAGTIRAIKADRSGTQLLVLAEHATFWWDGSSLHRIAGRLKGAAWLQSPSSTTPSTSSTVAPSQGTGSALGASASSTGPSTRPPGSTPSTTAPPTTATTATTATTSSSEPAGPAPCQKPPAVTPTSGATDHPLPDPVRRTRDAIVDV